MKSLGSYAELPNGGSEYSSVVCLVALSFICLFIHALTVSLTKYLQLLIGLCTGPSAVHIQWVGLIKFHCQNMTNPSIPTHLQDYYLNFRGWTEGLLTPPPHTHTPFYLQCCKYFNFVYICHYRVHNTNI